MSDLETITEALLSAARKAGADAADAMAYRGDSVSIETTGGKLEHAERAEAVEAGVRVIRGQKQASIASSDLTSDGIAEMAERAMAMAEVAPDDPYCGLADPDQLVKDTSADALDMVDAAEPVPADLQEMCLAGEAAAREVAGVAQIEVAGAAWSGTDVYLAGTNGFSGGYRRTSWSNWTVAISGEGLQMERDHCSEGRTHLADLPDPAETGRIAGERAVSRAGARKPPTGSYPVLYDERVASSLIGHLVAAVNGSRIARGSSWLKEDLGKAILPPGMDLEENPLKPRSTRSKPFDAEGLPAARRKIVDDGILTGWTLDLSTARQLGLSSTANAGRNPGGTPGPALTNLSLSEGTKSPEDLMAEMSEGLLVTSLIGATISETTGDYSRGASGFWIEGGKIAYPVNECTIADNLRTMLASLVPANDARPHQPRAVPSLLVPRMTIAGA